MTIDEKREIIKGVLAIIGWPMREADYQVVVMMSSDSATEDELIDVAAEYAWDHILGEPRKPTAKKLATAAKAARKAAR